MRVTKDYLQSPQYEFTMRYVSFWSDIASNMNMETYEEMDNYVPKFASLCRIIENNICNFSDLELEKINVFLCDVASMTSDIHEFLFDESVQYVFHLRKQCAILDQKNKDIHDDIVTKIHSKHTINGNGSRIVCPIEDVFLSREFLKVTYETTTDPYVIIWEFRQKSKIYHYYLMLYVYDLSLRMQEIRNMIIKFELARNGKQSGTVLDVIINENFFIYREINKEMRKYSQLMKNTCFYTHHDYMYPNKN